jgi:N-acetylglucosaminyldiphosphoundecaprenol N-acetyl-beta-D-mannosaminyltransferase
MLGVPVDDVTMDDAVDDVARFISVGRRTGAWHQIATVNLDFLTNAVRDDELRHVLQRTSLSIPDGMPVIWAARLLRSPLRVRVAGVDLVEMLAERAVTTGWTMYLFGGAAGVAEAAARLLTERHPGARIIGDSGPDYVDVRTIDPSLLDRIRAERPDVVCVALGNPKQERWIQRYGPALGVPVLIGVGGTFDFLVGRRRRAPTWMQRAGLEWMYRALQEPVRLGRRYAADAIVCGPRLATEIWRERRTRRSDLWSPAAIEQTPVGEVRIRAGAALDVARDDGLSNLELDRGRQIEVDMAAIGPPDRRTIETLVALARASGSPLRLTGLGQDLRRRLVRDHVLELVTNTE